MREANGKSVSPSCFYAFRLLLNEIRRFTLVSNKNSILRSNNAITAAGLAQAADSALRAVA